MEGQIDQIANQVGERKRGKFPRQPVPNPKLQFVIRSSSTSTRGQEHVQAITTLRSVKEVDNQVATPKEATDTAKEEESQDKPVRDVEPDMIIPSVEDHFQICSKSFVSRKTDSAKEKLNVQ
jgi:hypothetical protein